LSKISLVDPGSAGDPGNGESLLYMYILWACRFASMGGAAFSCPVNMKSISTSTTVINGRKITTKK